MGRVEREDCSSGDKEDSRTAPNASIWEGWKAPKFSLFPLKVPAPTPSPGVVADSCCPLRSLPGQLRRRRPCRGGTGAGQCPGQGSASRHSHSPGSRAGKPQLLGQVELGSWSRAGTTRLQLLQPNATSLENKLGSSLLAGREAGELGGSPSLSCPLTPAEVQQRWRELSAPERSGDQDSGVLGGKLHSPCKWPSMVLEESEKEGKPVFSSVHGRTGEAGRGRGSAL